MGANFSKRLRSRIQVVNCINDKLDSLGESSRALITAGGDITIMYAIGNSRDAITDMINDAIAEYNKLPNNIPEDSEPIKTT